MKVALFRSSLERTGGINVSVYLVMIFLLTYPIQTRFALGARLDGLWATRRQPTRQQTNSPTIQFADNQLADKQTRRN